MQFITICLCTYQRKSLEQTLIGIAKLNINNELKVNVVLVDSDLNGSAKSIFNELKPNYPFDISYYVANEPGVSAARNMAVSKSTGDWLAFIDDDEIPGPNWIVDLLNCAFTYKANVVFGSVVTEYPIDCPFWISQNDLFGKSLQKTGSLVTHGATANVLILRELIVSKPILFDNHFGATGGEDTELFLRLSRNGARMITCREAWVSEIVESKRLNKEFLLKKALRIGETYTRIFAYPRGFGFKAVYLFRAAVQSILALLIAFFLLPFSYGLYMKFKIKSVTNFGKVKAFFSNRFVELYKG